MRKFILCGSVVFILLSAAAKIEAKDVTVFEKTYVRKTGAPITETDTLPETYGLVKIRVTNGLPEETGSKKTSGSVIALNGEVIINESSFKQNESVIEIEKTLSGEINTMKAALKGKPGGSLKVQVLAINAVALPPDPGKEGKKTLLGIDSDGDGVRDDIERYIYFAYPDEEKLRLGLTYYAKELQNALADAHDREAAYEHEIKMTRHSECLWYLKGEESIDILDALLAEYLNTRERSIAYIIFSDNLGGTNIRMSPLKEWKNSCSFDADDTGAGQ